MIDAVHLVASGVAVRVVDETAGTGRISGEEVQHERLLAGDRLLCLDDCDFKIEAEQ